MNSSTEKKLFWTPTLKTKVIMDSSTDNKSYYEHYSTTEKKLFWTPALEAKVIMNTSTENKSQQEHQHWEQSH